MVDKKLDIYEIITDRIIHKIETEQRLPWMQPWKAYGSKMIQPQNLVTKKPYRGINVWLLAGSLYQSPYWLTYKQAAQLKGSVRKGEKGTPVIYWHWFEKESKVGSKTKAERIPVLKYYTVFNVEQCENIDYPKPEQADVSEADIIDAAELIVANMPKKPRIEHGEARAYYSPAHDLVNMPKKESFSKIPEYYSTLFHELVHSTGHESRCARMKSLNDWNRFGSDPYAKEELVAEMGSAFLCGISGIQSETENNAVAYLQDWIAHLKSDKKLLVQAAGQAQKAVDFILNSGLQSESETD